MKALSQVGLQEGFKVAGLLVPRKFITRESYQAISHENAQLDGQVKPFPITIECSKIFGLTFNCLSQLRVDLGVLI